MRVEAFRSSFRPEVWPLGFTCREGRAWEEVRVANAGKQCGPVRVPRTARVNLARPSGTRTFGNRGLRRKAGVGLDDGVPWGVSDCLAACAGRCLAGPK